MPSKVRDVSVSKRCPKCKTSKAPDQFYSSKSTVHGLSVYCKECTVARHDEWRRKNLDRMREVSRKWRQDNPDRAKAHCRKQNYGLPIGGYETMLAAQNGCCAICRSTVAGGRGAFHVDHCHETGRIRGLLCHGCNVSIGHFKHNPILLEEAARYLLLTERR